MLSHGTCSQDDHPGRRNPGHGAKQTTSALKLIAHVFRGNENGHRARDFAHGSDHRLETTAVREVFVSNTGNSTAYNFFEIPGFHAGQMQCGENHLTLTQIMQFFRRNRPNLHHQRALVHFGRTIDQQGSRFGIILIREKAVDSRIPFHDHFMAVVHQQGNPLRRYGDSIFLKTPLAGYSNFQANLFAINFNSGNQWGGLDHGVQYWESTNITQKIAKRYFRLRRPTLKAQTTL